MYSLKDSGYTSQTIFVSNNGERLVIIDDYIESNAEPKRPVLKFYNNGRLTNAYGLYNLVSSHCFCKYSVSHVHWVLHDFSLSKNEDTFSLATYEFYEYEFNADGTLLKKQRPQGYNDSTAIVYGDYFRVRRSSNTYQMQVKVYVAGAKQEGDKVQFKAKHLSKQGLQVFMIANGIDVTPKRYRLNSIIFNWCHERGTPR